MQERGRIKKWLAVLTAVSLIVPFMGNTSSVKAAKSIQELEQGKQQLQNEVDALDSELVNLLADINVLEGDISRNKTEIADVKEELKAARAAEARQYADMKMRIKYMYENDSKSIWTMLLESGSIADFLNRVAYANAVYEYDRNLLASYEATAEAVRDMKVALRQEREELVARQNQLRDKQGTLNVMIASKRSEIEDFDAQLQKAREIAARQAAERARREAEARARANAEAVSRAAQLERQQQEEETAKVEQQEESTPAAEESSSTKPKKNEDVIDASDEDEDDGDVIDESGDEETYIGSDDSSYEESSQPEPATSVSGSSVASYASQFVGNPYVWGGNSLTNGCDCSGFVVQVYSHFGIDLSATRTSGALEGVGQSVSYENLQPGDIVCYPGHVAIYAGGGRIVEAQSSKTGITSNRSVTCGSITAIRRVV